MPSSDPIAQPISPWKHRVIRMLQFVVVSYLLMGAGLYLGQKRFIFVPTKPYEKTPEVLGLRSQSVQIPLPGEAKGQLQSWFLEHPRPIATLLYLHGNGHNIGSNINQAKRLYNQGFSVLLLDYRGYGQSDGSPSEQGVYADAEAAWQYLVTKRNVNPKSIVLYGHSLGGAIATELATQHPDAMALIVHSSFTSMPAMASRQWYSRLFFPYLVLNQRFDSIAKVPKLQVPTLWIHGTADTLIPSQMSEELYRSAPAKLKKQLILMPNAGHNNGDLFWNQGLASQIKTFVTNTVTETGNVAPKRQF
jgi:uncharacterized protein